MGEFSATSRGTVPTAKAKTAGLTRTYAIATGRRAGRWARAGVPCPAASTPHRVRRCTRARPARPMHPAPRHRVTHTSLLTFASSASDTVVWSRLLTHRAPRRRRAAQRARVPARRRRRPGPSPRSSRNPAPPPAQATPRGSPRWTGGSSEPVRHATARPTVLAARLGHRPLPPPLTLDAEPVGALDALEREREAAELHRGHRLGALAELGHGAERQRPQGLDGDARTVRLGARLTRALPSSAKPSASRCADQAVDGCGPAAFALLHGAMVARAANAVHRTMVRGAVRRHVGGSSGAGLTSPR